MKRFNAAELAVQAQEEETGMSDTSDPLVVYIKQAQHIHYGSSTCCMQHLTQLSSAVAKAQNTAATVL